MVVKMLNEVPMIESRDASESLNCFPTLTSRSGCGYVHWVIQVASHNKFNLYYRIGDS